MKSAITICLVPEAHAGPFVFHAGLADGCQRAAELGFDAVEIFPRDAASFPGNELNDLLTTHGLRVAAVGTGAGWLVHKLSLTDPDPARRAAARSFIGGIIEVAGAFQAPAIIGSMQGRQEGTVTRAQALEWLGAALVELGDLAARHEQVLLYEPLNRYETNLLQRQADAADFVRQLGSAHVKLLCDLFHMNIEERDLAQALLAAGETVGHIHWADSNRQAMGRGHTAPGPIVEALRRIGYDGYLSAEVFPIPDALDAARQTIASVRTSSGLRPES